MLTTAYVARRVTYALANDNLVMRDTSPTAQTSDQTFTGYQTTQWVRWFYQGNATEALDGLNYQPRRATRRPRRAVASPGQ